MRICLHGIPVSPGIVHGKLLKWQKPGEVQNPARPELDLSLSREAWGAAVGAVGRLLDDLCDRTSRETGPDQAGIFAAQRMMLEDPMLEEAVFSEFGSGGSLDCAVINATEGLARKFELLDNQYMRERGADIRDIGARLAGFLRGDVQEPILAEPGILVAHDLSPSQTAMLDKKLLLGMALEGGGRTTHTAILARSMDIPAVAGVAGLLAAKGETILIDGGKGIVIVDPEPDDLAICRNGAEPVPGLAAPEAAVLNCDGTGVRIAANIGSPGELATMRKYGVCGVGLCRTEFLYMQAGTLPPEEVQFDAYRRIAGGCAPHEVIFRTLDIGGDKELPGLSIPAEANPFLGLRGLRLCLAFPKVLKTQLRAMLRASAFGRVAIMFPMVTTLEEYRQVISVVREVQGDLLGEGIPFDRSIRFGIMIETPAAALLADKLAPEVDFFSIGTNDLTQYTMAADRMNERVAYLNQPFHPAVLRLIHQIIKAAHDHGKKAGMCGEMAGMPEAALLLIGLGLDEFSMSPSAAPAVRAAIQGVSHEKARHLARQALECNSADEVLELVGK